MALLATFTADCQLIYTPSYIYHQENLMDCHIGNMISYFAPPFLWSNTIWPRRLMFLLWSVQRTKYRQENQKLTCYIVGWWSAKTALTTNKSIKRVRPRWRAVSSSTTIPRRAYMDKCPHILGVTMQGGSYCHVNGVNNRRWNLQRCPIANGN